MGNITDNLRIKIALDTQILAYLADGTYPSLTTFIKTLAENPFVDIECSRFAIYEFIGIRKLEHYLRCLVNEAERKGGKLNFSSALKYKSGFDSPELKYINAYEKVKREVEKELNEIYDNFGIIYETINIHNDLWKPHQDLVLSTRISKEDSLLLLSSIFPDSFFKEQYLVLLTNDEPFYKAFSDPITQRLQANIFNTHLLTQPNISFLRHCTLEDKTTINLVETNVEGKIIDFTNQFILEHIKNKNKSSLLGKVIDCDCSKELKKQILCFRLEDEKELIENIYVSILNQKDFQLYNHPVKLNEFYNYGVVALPYKSKEDEKSKEISIKLLDNNGNNIEEKLMRDITRAGNLIFIHPDSFIG